MNKLIDLAARVLMAQIFIIAGIGKLGPGYAGTQGFMESMGVPGVLLPLVILTELGGGLALILGFQTRIVAFLLAGFTLLTALIFHTHFADQIQMIMFMKNLVMAGGLLMVMLHGAGELSVDAARKRK
ncbi:DoxX family protein [Crenobacter cavernae]|uniref:DoxX family protein n=1 Tax=Crenobacter cavernae TaxID=2290923 RepID=A0ABY0F9S0_9NEIS|nr:DoxX family protein [Crenobacter cavernae]RXZ42228.1 DoxX family protein [Crenobacter cavernae]